MRIIRLSSFLAVSFLLLATSAYAFGEIRYPDRPLNLRSARSARAGWVGTLYPGQKVRIAHLKDGWVAIYEPDETRDTSGAVVGYSNVKYLKKKRTRHEPKEWGELVYTPQTLNVRSKPSLRGKRVAKLQPGQHVKVDFPDGDWVRVFPPEATIRSEMGGFGYSSNKYFKPATADSMAKAGLGTAPTPEQEPEAVVEKKPEPPSLTLKEITKTINVRQSRTSVSPLVKTLQPGDLIKIGLARSGWYAVFSKDETVVAESKSIGYALESLVDAGSQVPTPKPAVEAEPEVRAVVTPPALKPESIVQPEPEVEPKTVLAAELEPAVEKPAPVEKSTPVTAPEPKPEPIIKSGGKQQVMRIDPKSFSGGNRPDPTPDKMAHGYKYKVMEKAETRQLGETWISLKVFLATTKLPSSKALKDFSTTLWKENRQVTKNLAVQIYLPGMDTGDLSYGVIKFSDEAMLEYWVRKATLFGTDFM